MAPEEMIQPGPSAAGPAIRVTFVPTAGEQARAQLAVLRGTGLSRAVDTAGPFIMAGMTAWTVLEEGWGGLLGLAMVFPIMLMTWLLLRPITRWSIQRHRRQNPHLVGPHAYTFTAAGVHLESPLGTVDMPWTSFVRARETRELLLLYFARKAAYFVPRRALRDTDELRLRELLAAQLGPLAELTKPQNG